MYFLWGRIIVWKSLLQLNRNADGNPHTKFYFNIGQANAFNPRTFVPLWIVQFFFGESLIAIFCFIK
jgi:hypothetical protein